MIRRRVVDADGLQPQMPLEILVRNDAAETFDAVVDTGFTDYASLPPEAVERLDLPFVRHAVYVIAGKRQVKIPVHAALVDFGGETFEIDVLAQEGEPLVGMAFLVGCRLSIHVTSGGEITIEKTQVDFSRLRRRRKRCEQDFLGVAPLARRPNA